MSSSEARNARTDPGDENAPRIKIAAQMTPEPREVDFQFVRQMGIEHAVVWVDEPRTTVEYYTSRKALFADHGVDLIGVNNLDVNQQPELVIGGPNYPARLEVVRRHIQALGRAGIPYTTYAHMPNGIWSTEREAARGGASARAFDLAKGGRGYWKDQTYDLQLTNGREYSEAEVWDTFATFIRGVARVAEDEGVLVGIHPADPPIAWIGGIRRLFSDFADYERALAMADSPNVGVCLCVGCWLEGGAAMGVGVLEAIRRFAAEKKLFKVHFRNVSAPLPHFVETFLDEGYQAMYPVMRTLQEVGFRGIAIPDHIPTMADDPRLGTAFSLGYMKALRERAEAEVGAEQSGADVEPLPEPSSN